MRSIREMSVELSRDLARSREYFSDPNFIALSAGGLERPSVCCLHGHRADLVYLIALAAEELGGATHI